MKLPFKVNFLVALACLLVLGSCSEDESVPPKTDAELIGSGIAWKLSTVTSNDISVVSFIDACVQDNLITFYFETSGNKGVVDEGSKKCDESDSQLLNFNWEYNESTKILTVDTDIIEVPGAEGGLVIERVSSSELVISQNIKLLGTTQKAILTLVH